MRILWFFVRCLLKALIIKNVIKIAYLKAKKDNLQKRIDAAKKRIDSEEQRIQKGFYE